MDWMFKMFLTIVSSSKHFPMPDIGYTSVGLLNQIDILTFNNKCRT